MQTSGGTAPRLLIVAHEWAAWSQHRTHFATAALKHGWNVTVLAPDAPDREVATSQGSFRTRAWALRRGIDDSRRIFLLDTVRAVRGLRKIIQDEQPDSIEFVTLHPSIIGLLLAAMPGGIAKSPRICVTMAGLGSFLLPRLDSKESPHGRMRWVLRSLFRRAHSVIVENSEHGELLLTAGVASKEQLLAMRGVGLDDTWLDPNATPPSEQRDAETVLYVGRLLRDKGLPELLEAFGKVRESVPTARLRLVGAAAAQNPTAMTSEDLVGWHGVELVGEVDYPDAVRREYLRAALLVLPSHHEGRSRVLMEAQAMGCPVIASDIAGCREVVNTEPTNRTGLLVPPRDSRALATAIISLLSDEKQRLSMSEAGRRWAADEFRAEDVIAPWVDAVLVAAEPRDDSARMNR